MRKKVKCPGKGASCQSTALNKPQIVFSDTITIRMSEGDIILSRKHIDEVWNRIVRITEL